MLIIEVASLGNESSENYQQKPTEYVARGVLEYWIIDPDRQWVKIGSLINGAYQFADFTGNQCILSPTFPQLNLTAEQILNVGR